jgi:hypothetical protein
MIRKEKKNVNSLVPLLIQTNKRKKTSISISSIVDSDKELLQKTVKKFRPQSINYEDSWGYIIQATRYDGFKWYDPYSGSLIFFGRKSNTDKTLVATTVFSEPEYLANVIQTIQNILKTEKTILKNINPEDVDSFTSYGFRTYLQEEGWSYDVPFDDQTFPQKIIDAKKLQEAKGDKYHNLRTNLHKEHNLFYRRYEDSDKDNVLKLFALKDGNTEINEQAKQGMYYISHAMYPTADVQKYVITDKITNELLGFTATSEISKESKSAALVAAIFKPNISVLSIWGMYQTIVQSYREGYSFVSLGGCETEGTHIFMNRMFRPIIQLPKTHLVYDPYK